MRTTIDIPDDLFRRVKARAALEGRKLKDLIAEYVEQGLDRGPVPDIGERRRRSPLPVIPKAATGRTIPALSNAEIQAILDQEDAEQANRLAGR
jgi:hypothetical protein